MKRNNPRPTIRPRSPADSQEPLRPSVGLGIEISLIAAFSFVFSGATNWWMFWKLWRIDYFSIATPQDVAMNGFLLTALIVVMSLISGIVITAVSALVASVLSAIANKVNPKEKMTPWQMAVGRRVKPTLGAMVAYVKFAMFLSVTVVTAATAFSVTASGEFYGDTGLYVSHQSKLPEDCLGRPIIWMGSQAAIFDCDGDLRVERDFERLQIYRPIAPKPENPK